METISIALCGKKTRRGNCKMRLTNNGKCGIHDLTDLSARNAAVAQAFRERHPDAFHAQRSSAGKRGFARTGIAQWEIATNEERLYRLAHPSEPEQLLGAVLADFGIWVLMEREYVIDGDPRAVDVAFPYQRCCIECTERPDRASFGRNDKRAAKRAWLEALGWSVHYFYYAADYETEVRRLQTFLAAHGIIVPET